MAANPQVTHTCGDTATACGDSTSPILSVSLYECFIVNKGRHSGNGFCQQYSCIDSFLFSVFPVLAGILFVCQRIKYPLAR